MHNIQKDIAEFGSTFKNETHQNIESMWQSFKTEIKFIIDKRVPTKMTKPKHTHPWMNTDIRRKINTELMLKPGKQKRKKTRIDIKDYKQKSSMKSGKQARNT